MIRVLQVVSPLHVGEGTAIGSVDLPVARERYTGWPYVPGSALKGALRDHCRRRGASDGDLVRVFGSEPGVRPLARGSLELGDGALLALAVRSLGGTLALLTSPLALGRLARWLPSAPPVPEVGVERVACRDPATFVVRELSLAVLEDLPLLAEASDAVGAWADLLRRALGEEAPLDRLAVVHDDVFSFAAQAWLPVRTRASIGEDGVVRDGFLFSVEAVPPESLLAVPLAGHGQELLPGDGEVFVVGGQKTVGSGRIAWFGGLP